MMRLIMLILALLLSWNQCEARNIVTFFSPLASCTTANDSVLVDLCTESTTSQDGISDTVWLGQQFILSSDSTVTGFRLYTKRGDISAGNVTLNVYTNNSGAPGSLVSNTQVVVGYANFSQTFDYVDFILTTPKALTAGTYLIVVHSDTSTVSDFYWSYATVDSGVGSAYSSNSGTSYNVYADDYQMEVLGCVN